MTEAENYDSIEAGRRTSEMWLRLADQIAAAVPDLVISGDPVKAIHWATCAEACLWKATGEASTHDIGDVLPKGYGIEPERTVHS